MGRDYNDAIYKEECTSNPRKDTRHVNQKGRRSYYAEWGFPHRFDGSFELDPSQKGKGYCEPNLDLEEFFDLTNPNF